MDSELKKGFQELQSQIIETREKLANIGACEKLTAHELKINESILDNYTKDAADIEGKFFYQPIGRMLVKREGKKAHDFLLERSKQYQGKLKQYKEVKEICMNQMKESENRLRELVNKKLNKSEQSTSSQDKPAADMLPSQTPTTTTTTSNSTSNSNPDGSVVDKNDENKQL